MADVDEIVTGRRREGAFAGVMTFVRKTMQAVAVMLVGLMLQAGGFVLGIEDPVARGHQHDRCWSWASAP